MFNFFGFFFFRKEKKKFLIFFQKKTFLKKKKPKKLSIKKIKERERMETNRTFIMIKPDGVERNIVGKIISKFEQENFRLVDIKKVTLTLELVQKHYIEHKGKHFYEGLCSGMVGDGKQQVIAMIWSGENIIQFSRKMIGATVPENAALGTIRRRFGLSMQKNTIHGSDSPESALREINLWFPSETPSNETPSNETPSNETSSNDKSEYEQI